MSGKRQYDWNKFGRPRTAMYNRVMGWLLTCVAVASLPLFLIVALREWTVIFAWLLITAGAVAVRLGLRKIYRAEPDYSAIAAMEREVYGETFEHEGAPAVARPVRMVAGQTRMCRRCMTPYARFDGFCPRCYRTYKEAARGERR